MIVIIMTNTRIMEKRDSFCFRYQGRITVNGEFALFDSAISLKAGFLVDSCVIDYYRLNFNFVPPHQTNVGALTLGTYEYVTLFGNSLY